MIDLGWFPLLLMGFSALEIVRQRDYQAWYLYCRAHQFSSFSGDSFPFIIITKIPKYVWFSDFITTGCQQFFPPNPVISERCVTEHTTVYGRVQPHAFPCDHPSLGRTLPSIKNWLSVFMLLLTNNYPSTLYKSLTPFLTNTNRWLVGPHYQLSEHRNKHFLKCNCKKKILRNTLIWKEPTAESWQATFVGKKFSIPLNKVCKNSKTCQGLPSHRFSCFHLKIFSIVYFGDCFFSIPSNLQGHTFYLFCLKCLLQKIGRDSRMFCL